MLDDARSSPRMRSDDRISTASAGRPLRRRTITRTEDPPAYAAGRHCRNAFPRRQRRPASAPGGNKRVGELGKSIGGAAPAQQRRRRSELDPRNRARWRRRRSPGRSGTSAHRWGCRRRRQPSPARVDVDAEPFGDEEPRRGQLVVAAEPAVHMDRRDLGGSPEAFDDRDDAADGRLRQARDVLAEVDGEIGLAVGLVGGDGSPWHLGEHRRRMSSSRAASLRRARPPLRNGASPACRSRHRGGTRTRRSRPPPRPPAIGARCDRTSPPGGR